MEYTINNLAKLAGVSVRTLHFYHQTALLTPLRVGENGYRYYGSAELARLQQILFFRELKFPLDHIKQILDSPNFDQLQALEQQAELLQLERDRLDQVLATIRKTINMKKGTTTMSDADFYSGLSREELDNYAEEAKQRWGNTQAYKQSQERMSKLSEEEKRQLPIKAAETMREYVKHMSQGFDSPKVQALVDEQFKSINELFYDCSIQMFQNLAEMTSKDERYAHYYRKFHPDLPEFRLRAVTYYCQQ